MTVPKLTDLKQYVNVTDSDHDGVLTELLDAAIAKIGRESGLAFSSSSRTVYLSGGRHGTAALWFTGQPVTVSTVEIRDSSLIGGSTWTELEASEWEQLGGRLQRTGLLRWPRGDSNIRVTLATAYSEADPFPDDLRLAILRVAAAGFQGRKTATPTTRRSEGGGATSGDVAAALEVARSYRQVPGF